MRAAGCFVVFLCLTKLVRIQSTNFRTNTLKARPKQRLSHSGQKSQKWNVYGFCDRGGMGAARINFRLKITHRTHKNPLDEDAHQNRYLEFQIKRHCYSQSSSLNGPKCGRIYIKDNARTNYESVTGFSCTFSGTKRAHGCRSFSNTTK